MVWNDGGFLVSDAEWGNEYVDGTFVLRAGYWG